MQVCEDLSLTRLNDRTAAAKILEKEYPLNYEIKVYKYN
jgi:hypothetical protein